MKLSVCEACGAPFERKTRRQSRCDSCNVGRAGIEAMRKTSEYKAARAALLAEKDVRCAWCGAPATTADHVDALADGGGHGKMVPSCGSCNSRRGGRMMTTGRGSYRHV